MLFRNTVSYAAFNCRLVSSVGRALVCWGGGGGVLRLSIAREVGDKGRQAAVCRILALSFYEAGDYIQSIESSKEELAIAREEPGNKKRNISVRCSGQVLSARRRIQTEY